MFPPRKTTRVMPPASPAQKRARILNQAKFFMLGIRGNLNMTQRLVSELYRTDADKVKTNFLLAALKDTDESLYTAYSMVKEIAAIALAAKLSKEEQKQTTEAGELK